MKNKKKGFTLVELLVVIAILAVLATVTTVGYLNFVDKAEKSNDISITKQMNTVLLGNEASNKAKNMTEVRNQLLENGLDIEKLSPTSEGYNFVWDTKTNRILLLDENDNKVSPNDVNDQDTSDTFVILHKQADMQKWVDKNYSIYLAADYDATTVSVDKVTGVDAGNSNVKEITIKGTERETVLVNGKLDKLTVNTPNATINQYGSATVADVQAVDPNNSLHVFGKIIKLDVTSGHVVVEAKAEVSTVTDTQQNSNVTVDIKVSATVGAVVSAKVDILVQGSNKPVEPEVVKPEAVNKDFAGGIGTKASPYLISTEEQFKKIDTQMNEYKEYKLLNDLYFDKTNINASKNSVVNFLNGSIDGNNKTIYINVPKSTNTFRLIDSLPYKSGNNPTTVMIKDLMVDFKHEDTNLTEASGVALVYDAFYKKNGAPYNDILVFDNVDTTGEVLYNASKNNVGIYGVYVQGSVVYRNCDNNVNITSLGYNSAFLGYVYGNNKAITFENCSYNGNLVGKNVGVLLGNLSSYNKALTKLTINGLAVTGNLSYFGPEGSSKILGAMNSSDTATKTYINELESKLQTSKLTKLGSLEGMTLSLDAQTNEISINYANTNNKVAYYKVVLTKYNLMNKYDKVNKVTTEYGGTVLHSIEKTFNTSGKTGLFKGTMYQLDNFGGKYYDSNKVQQNAKFILSQGQYTVLETLNSKYDIIEVNGKKAYLLKSNEASGNADKVSVIHNESLSVELFAFDANSRLIGYTTLK